LALVELVAVRRLVVAVAVGVITVLVLWPRHRRVPPVVVFNGGWSAEEWS
jgi:hypothetical protein